MPTRRWNTHNTVKSRCGQMRRMLTVLMRMLMRTYGVAGIRGIRDF